MTENDLLSALDSQIALLERARNLLTGSGTSTRAKKSAARPVKRTMSAEA